MVQSARANSAPGVDKICVVVNMEDFTVRNSMSRNAIMEGIEILTIVYPETLGHLVLWQPPGYAYTLFKLFKKFLDPRTLKKILFVSGDASPGSANDNEMAEVVGPNWRVLTGLVSPRAETAHSEKHRREIPCARGFRFDAYWQGAIQRDRDRAALSGGPPWPLQWHDVIDEDQWDGAYRAFWEANLLHEPTEVWASPAQSETEPWEDCPLVDPSVPQVGAEVGTESPRVPPQVLGKPALPTLGAHALPGGRTAAPFRGRAADVKAPSKSTASGLCCIGHTSLVVHVLLAANTVLEIVAHQWMVDHRRVMLLLHEVGLLNLPLVSVGLGVLFHGAPVAHGCECLCPRSQCLPWALLLLRIFAMPETLRNFAEAMAREEQQIGPARVSMELGDAVLSIVFALSWLRLLARQADHCSREPPDAAAGLGHVAAV